MTSSSSAIDTEIFWYDDPNILFATNKITQFFPHKSYTLNQKLNSLVRLGLYSSIIMICYEKDIKWSSIFIFSLLFTFYLKNNYTTQKTKTSPVNIVPPPPTPSNSPVINTQIPIVVAPTPFSTTTSIPVTETVVPDTTVPIIETPTPTPTTNISIIPSNDYIEPLDNVNCVEPTIDNPFMNMTMKDYLNFDKNGNIVERNKACDPNESDIKKKVDQNFNNNLYRDVSDVFGKYNSQRQYFTMPWTQTIPDVDGEFKNWLYKNPKTCKEDNDYCLRYEDVRFKSPRSI
jgi:hypothetical protein